MTPRDVLKLCEQKEVQFVDLRFMDFPGLWQHTTLPVSELTIDSFSHGFGFDGSSIRGWQAINESDMLLVPVADTAKIDPFMQHTTISMICDVRDPITKKEYSRDPRSIARKAVTFLQKTKIADTAYFGPELEFFIFDQAFYDQGINFAKYYVGSREGIWGRGDEDPLNLGYKVRLKEGYFPTPPMDTMQNIRSEMVATLIE
ncbi:MAG: Glutamine synthetase type, partial [Phycisphaerales bacterium]|nr:Glutamine synthetase type [Phycisphaerales bacterium]